MSQRECVLVVDELSDTAEVLQAVLAPRGVAVNRVRNLDDAHAAAFQPSVLVVDAESQTGDLTQQPTGWQSVPQVVIGTFHWQDHTPPANAPESAPARRLLQKPFHFAALLQAIEALIPPPVAPLPASCE